MSLSPYQAALDYIVFSANLLFVKTSLVINDELYRQVKAKAALEGESSPN